MTTSNEEISQDDLQENLIKRLEVIKRDIEMLMKGMTKNQLTRAIRNVVNFPMHDFTEEEAQSEARNIRVQVQLQQLLYEVKDIHTNLAIITLGEMQKQQQQNGENNE